MARVFMSHSRTDKIGQNLFNKLFGTCDHEAYWYSFEGPTPPHAKTLLEAIKGSASVFVILSRPMTEPHTRSWVGYEVGIAASLGKNVWVFEQKDTEYVQVPVPYLTGYIQYPKEIEQKDTYPFADIVKTAGLKIPGLKVNVKSPIFHSTFCQYEDCQAPYYVWVYDTKYLCPVCRRKRTRIDLNELIKSMGDSLTKGFTQNDLKR